jgi:simple sugar transport system substrate-binding protein
MRARRRISVGAALAVAALALAGCDKATGPDTTTANAAAKGSGRTFAVITHGAAGDTFWDVVKKGAEQAGKDLGVTVQY